ncbi:uncharacterized protein LOC121007616 [Bufo bufo]|uniref:uncharacterized protein LOC121007616 n=1 Tax=Bufo bufo TaxID=8384 RepID=UPI001ABE2006|nr:uncharacterized protein LOC121007616 [Bufo bufo]XP_040295599.1 uncharacterized protein LOC121007616 [Bufo bufo]
MPSLRYVSNEYERHYRPRGYQRFKTNNVASSSILSKIRQVSSEHFDRRIRSLKNVMMMKSTKSEQHTTICQGEEILSVQEELHQESSCEFSALNGVTVIADESVCQEDHGSDCSFSQYTYKATDGYQSGESNSRDVQRLCEECKTFYKKLRTRKGPAIIKDRRSTDPGPWYGKSWIFVNQSSARGSRKTSKRSLESALKRLRDLPISRCSPPARPHWTCCRCHLFLKRNIRLCKEAQKTSIFKDQSKKKRKLPNSGRKSKRPKKYLPSNREEETELKIGQKARKTYSLDSSQEEIANPEIKRFKLEVRNTGKKTLLQNTETSSNSVHMTSSTFEPMGHDARPTSKYPVHAGSFREQLEKLKMGEIKSGIIKEN